MKICNNQPFSLYKSIRFATAVMTCVLVGSLTSTALAYTESTVDSRNSQLPIDHFPLLADSRSDKREFDRPDSSGRHRENPKRETSRAPRNRDYKTEYRAAPQHREQHQPRYQRNRSVEAPNPNYRDRDHRFKREYSTESHRHPPYPRYSPPPVVHPRHQHPRERVLVRPFRYVVPHHRHYRHDLNIWGLLTFTAITLAILDNLNDQQQREHELALYNATTTPLGETIYWQEGNASGAVTTTREGTSSTGRYCREYLSEVTIGGKQESVYGTACQQPDGSWEIIQ